VSEQEEIATARRQRGERLAAWRARAGLTQQEVGQRTDYSRSAVHNAERGSWGSRTFYTRADRALNAGGRLLADYDQTAIVIRAAQHEAARRARAALAQKADTPLAADVPEPDAVAFQDISCPNCHMPLTVTMGVHAVLVGSTTTR
jgi:transcriptional regulator with XRE-family HTH domain